jgi:hypothetical protein
VKDALSRAGMAKKLSLPATGEEILRALASDLSHRAAQQVST